MWKVQLVNITESQDPDADKDLNGVGDMNSGVGMSFGFNVLTYFVNKNNHSGKQVTEKPHLVLSFSLFSDRQHNSVHKVPKSKSAVLIP